MSMMSTTGCRQLSLAAGPVMSMLGTAHRVSTRAMCCHTRWSRPTLQRAPGQYKTATASATTSLFGQSVFPVVELSKREIHVTPVPLHKLDVRDKDHHKREEDLIKHHQSTLLDQVAKKARDKKTFQAALATYDKRHGVHRRGHVEFMYAALRCMKDFGVHRDLATYKKVIDLFPKGKMIARNAWQVEWMHYPKQQQCCIDVLDQMEYNGVIPDDEMGYQLRKIFGDKTHAFRKYRRMMYWLPKFKNANPYYVPHELPDNNIELAKMALKRMAVDLRNEVSVFQTSELATDDTAGDDTFIVMAQSADQRELLKEHSPDKPVFIEGGFITWLRYKSLVYFVLRADPTEKFRSYQENDTEEQDMTTFKWNFLQEEGDQISKEVAIPPSIHEQENGTILGMCITGTASKDSLASWVRILERATPCLSQIPVVFSLRTPEAGLQVVQDKDDFNAQATMELLQEQFGEKS